MKKKISLAFMLGFVLMLVIASLALALSSYPVDTDQIFAFNGSTERHIISAGDIYWMFSNNYYMISTDNGVTWGNKTSIEHDHVMTLGTFDQDVVMNRAGTDIYLFAVGYWTETGKAVVMRHATIGGNGSLTWQDWSKCLDTDVNQYVITLNCAVDDTGHYWFGISQYISGTKLKIYGSSATNGTWVNDASKYSQLASVGGLQGGGVIPVSIGLTVSVIYGFDNSYLYGRVWDVNTNSWGVEHHSQHTVRASYESFVPMIDASCVGDNAYGIVHIAYVNGSAPYNIYYTTYGLSVFLDDVIVQSGVPAETYPQVTMSTLTNDDYIWWSNYPLANHIYVKHHEFSYSRWDETQDLGAYAGIVSTDRNSAPMLAADDELCFSFMDSSTANTRFTRLYAGNGSAPYGVAMFNGEDITATTMIMRGLCSWSGGSGCNATFHYQGSGLNPATLPVQFVDTGDIFSGNLTNLIPDNLYWFWITFENDYGNFTTGDQMFRTLAGSGHSAPIVQTVAATLVTMNSAQLNGYLSYDGGLKCYCGFDWRLQGTSTWTRVWFEYTDVWPWSTDRPLKSGDTFFGTLSGLSRDFTYEYKAFAKNSLTEPDVVYGNVTTFTTGHYTATTPTPVGGPGITIPSIPGIGSLHLSGSLKIIIALIVTVGGMFLIALNLGKVKSNAAGIVVIGYGLCCVLGFSIFDWLPRYTLILAGGMLGLLILLSVQKQGNRG